MPKKSLPITAAVTTAQVASFLREHGLPVGTITPRSEVVDGEIELGAGCHVQVGEGYACLNRPVGDGVEFGAVRYDAMDLVLDYRKREGKR